MSRRMMMLVLVALSGWAPVATAQDDAAGKQNKFDDQIGYFLGVSIGQQLRQSGFRTSDFTGDALLSGLTDGLKDNEVALSDEQLQATQAKISGMLQKRQAELNQATKAKGEEFLVANKSKEGVKMLEGGVQYKVLKAGDGGTPASTDTVKVHYTGKLINGKVFDSSVQRGQPATFRVNQVIQGWQMALQKMQVGDKWMLYIPSELAYGERGSQAIGPNEVLVFEVELLAIQ